MSMSWDVLGPLDQVIEPTAFFAQCLALDSTMPNSLCDVRDVQHDALQKFQRMIYEF